MKKLYIISAILLLNSFCFANNDKKVQSKHLNYQEAISAYGNDEISVAIIDLYFEKRETSAKGKMSILPVTAIVAVAYPPIGIPMMMVATPIFVSGVITSAKYSNKRMIRVLTSYNASKKISKGLMKKVNRVINNQQFLLAEE